MTRLGDYELEDEIGRGGMGRVYRARHVPTGARRALKVIAGANDPEAIVRFRREAETLARIGADTAVRVHEAGHEGGRTYYVMELLEGGSLAGKGELPWREAVLLVTRIARAVARCHEKGVVHRDLKPANVLFDELGEPRLVDFGCARDLTASTLTETGTLLGTPGYMAPEQLDGGRGDERSDVYALGVMLHELVTGARPHRGRTWRELLLEAQKGLPGPVAAEAGAPLALDRVLARTLAPDPLRRTASAMDLVRELEAIAAGGPVARVRGRGLVLTFLLLVAGGAALAFARRGGERVAAPEPRVATGGFVLDDSARQRLRRGAGTATELVALASATGGKDFLRELVESAVVFPPDVVLEASASEKGSPSLALLRAIATLGASRDEVARGEAVAAIESCRPHGILRVLADAVKVARDLRGEANVLRRSSGKGAIDAPAALERALKPLAGRTDLVAAAALELAEDCRSDVLAGHATLLVKPVSKVIRLTPTLFAALEVLPPEVVVACGTYVPAEEWALLRQERDAEPVRVARSLERAARGLEAVEPVLAASALVRAVMIGQHAAGFTTLVEDEERALALLRAPAEGEGQEALFPLDQLQGLETWRAIDAVRVARSGSDPEAALAEGEIHAARAASSLARLRKLIRTGADYDEHELPPPGEAEHLDALLLLRLGRDASAVVLLPEDVLGFARDAAPDRAAIETAAKAILDKRTERPDFLFRSASCFLAQCLRAEEDELGARFASEVRRGIKADEALEWLETEVARRRIPP